MKQSWTLTKFRIMLAMRNRAFLFFGVIIPVALLFLFAAIFGRGGGRAVAYVLASILAMTVMGSFWGLSQQLVIFREQGILRRFRLAILNSFAWAGLATRHAAALLRAFSALLSISPRHAC